MTGGEDPIAWLRKEIERDLSAAKAISDGGFSAEQWDTEPPGQVNPEDIPQASAVSAALCLDEAERPCGWVQIVAYGKLNNEPDEAYAREWGAPVALVDSGRRQFEHIIRNDPRNVVADCEAKLAILDLHKPTWMGPGTADVPVWQECSECGLSQNPQCIPSSPSNDESFWPCRTVRLLASGYRHRPGFSEEDWKP